MTEKQTGYALLSVGIFIMLVIVVLAIMLFSGSLKPFPLFNIPAPTLDTAAMMPSIPGMPAAPGQKIQIIPTSEFNKMLNLGTQFLLFTFLLSFGYKIADLGIKLLRPIKIEAKP